MSSTSCFEPDEKNKCRIGFILAFTVIGVLAGIIAPSVWFSVKEKEREDSIARANIERVPVAKPPMTSMSNITWNVTELS